MEATAAESARGFTESPGGPRAPMPALSAVHFTHLGSSYAVALALPTWLVVSDNASYHTITRREQDLSP
jgi:hypothetical protein